jgi:thioredoxin reductase (NADPH)
MTMVDAKLLILGSGPAGYTAAVYAARAGLSPVLLQGMQPGGQLTITTEVENWPGDTSVLGPELMARMEAQARALGTEIVTDMIASADLSSGPPFLLHAESGATYRAQSVVIATGAQARWLGLESETRYRGFGVSACATCDGFFYRGRTVAVVGGGNTAVEEALYLTNFAEKVYLVHRRDTLRADRTNQARLFAHPKIEMIWDCVVEEVHGEASPAGVTAIGLRHGVSGDARRLDVHGMFVAIGHVPATAMFAGQLAMDEEGYILTRPDSTATSVPGVFAAGDVRDKLFRQAVTAAANGCMAALESERWLAGHVGGTIAG